MKCFAELINCYFLIKGHFDTNKPLQSVAGVEKKLDNILGWLNIAVFIIKGWIRICECSRTCKCFSWSEI